MSKESFEKLQNKYESVCEKYIQVFSKKQDVEFDGWIGGQIGGIAEFIGQYFFNFQDIVWDINSKQPKGTILQWQDDCLENAPKSINYFSYTKGLRFSDLK